MNQPATSNQLPTTIFLKLGGSLITDKTQVEHARKPVIHRLAREIKAACEVRPELQLVLGHGSGSFGHVAAKKHGTRAGVKDRSGWLGYATVAAAAARLNQIVTDIFVAEGVPVVSLPPSTSARCDDGRLSYLDTFVLRALVEHNLVPLVQGDVALDTVRGATIVSTEDVFLYLVREFQPTHILLAGEVAGVYEHPAKRDMIIPVITPGNVEQYTSALGGSHGTDVTGGMSAKVNQMLGLVQRYPSLEARIFSGAVRGHVQQLLIDPATEIGTAIRS
ncbi:MAG TPA: isopentenyl phosphate kinase [Anaerolineae bacterium]|nr:isopentenyl phosphate kinase [Anaerolineae bacterium]